jgi:hypothetical protein
VAVSQDYNESMVLGIGCRGLAVLLAAMNAMMCFAQLKEPNRPWKGYSILGNGHITAVYSDDSRITSLTGRKGIQHLYFRDYTVDYVASTSFGLVGSNGRTMRGSSAGASEIGMKNFFTAQTTTSLPDGSSTRTLCFVHPEDAVILSYGVKGAKAPSYRFAIDLRICERRSRRIPRYGSRLCSNPAGSCWQRGRTEPCSRSHRKL